MTTRRSDCCSDIFLLGPLAVIAQQQFSGGQSVTVTGALPAGGNAIGSVTATQATGSNLHVDVDSAPTTPVTGTFWQATQPTSLASLPALVAGTAKVGITYPYTGCGTTQFESGTPARFCRAGGVDYHGCKRYHVHPDLHRHQHRMRRVSLIT